MRGLLLGRRKRSRGKSDEESKRSIISRVKLAITDTVDIISCARWQMVVMGKLTSKSSK